LRLGRLRWRALLGVLAIAGGSSWLGGASTTAAATGPPSYALTDLGTLGGAFSYADAVNGTGEVVGRAYRPGALNSDAFVFDGTSMQDLGSGTLEGSDVNASGVVVGAAENGAEGFVWSKGSLTLLPEGAASAVNDSGQVVGTLRQIPHHAFVDNGGTLTDLGTLGGSSSEARDINKSGQIVGGAFPTAGSNYRAFLYSSGVMRDLTAPGGLGSSYSEAFGINDGGQVVGEASLPSGDVHAFLYANGVLGDLGTLGGLESTALAIDSGGDIVGRSDISQGGQDAFLYRQGQMIDLNATLPTQSGWTLNSAAGINDAGQIVGFAAVGRVQHAFLLTPTSGPSFLGTSTIANGEILHGKLPWIATVMGLPTSQVQTVQYFVDGVLRWTEGASPYYFNGDFNTLDTSTLSDGAHSFTVKVTTTTGSSASVLASALVENTNPSYTVSSSIADGQTISGQLPWTATSSDVGHTNTVDYYIDGVLRWTEGASPYYFNGDFNKLDTTALANGKHVLHVVATQSSYAVASAFATVTVNNGPFKVTSSITNGQTLSGQLPWTATITGMPAPVTTVKFSIDGVLRWTEGASPYYFNGDFNKLDTTTLTNGNHTFTVTATAADGTTATITATATVRN
jgi:probable HAF family extracellular repeat protein